MSSESESDSSRANIDTLDIRSIQIEPSDGDGFLHLDWLLESTGIRNDVHQLMENDRDNNENGRGVNEKVLEVLPRAAVLRKRRQMGVNEYVGVDRAAFHERAENTSS